MESLDMREVEGYLVTKCGRVFLGEEVISSRNKFKHFEYTLPLREVKLSENGTGYLIAQSSAKRKSMLVSRLVAIGWVPNPDCKEQVNHKDGVKSNNHFENLEWCTQSENMLHAYQTGLKIAHKGEKASKNILTNIQVSEIYLHTKKGILTQKAIADMYGVSVHTVDSIKRKHSWGWLTDNLDCH